VNEHLPALESAISDVGAWTWWTANLPAAFQAEFGGTQLWSPPRGEGEPPSGQIALLFLKPRLVYFLTLAGGVPEDWPDRLQRDELKPFGVDHEAFTLTGPELCGQLLAKAASVRALVGEPGNTPLPAAGEAFLAFAAGPVGMVVAAESLGVFNHRGELGEQAVLESNRQWWAYLHEYWRRKDTPDPLPRDYACEVTLPLTPEALNSVRRHGAGVAGASEVLRHHPAFGLLRWQPDGSTWYTQYRLPSGALLDVEVEPGGGDRYAFFEPAAKLFRWALDNERGVLATAIQAELLELYNGTWRRGNDPELSGAELAARLEWAGLLVSASEVVPVEFFYRAGELFGSHEVVVEVDAGLRFRDIDLLG
jgi:hypothetical protein